MNVTRTVTYEGPAPYANALVQILKEHHVDVEWAPPEERRDGAGVLEAVVIGIVASGAYDAIKTGVAKFRERYPRVKAEVEEEAADPDDEE
jgi:hypothetical protein